MLRTFLQAETNSSEQKYLTYRQGRIK